MTKTAGQAQIEAMVERLNLLEQSKDALVEKVESFMEQRKEKYGGKALPADMGHTQFQDLVGKAGATTSVKEITNFIQYQVGRNSNKKDSSKNKSWAVNSFGQELIEQVNEVSKMAGTDPELRIQMVRLFLGYLQRHARYLQETKQG